MRLNRDDDDQTIGVDVSSWYEPLKMGDEKFFNSTGLRRLGEAYAEAYTAHTTEGATADVQE